VTSLSRFRLTLLPGLVLGLGLTAGRVAAQAAAVVVRDGPGGPPVTGAIVRLMRGDSVVAQGLTSEAGRVTLRGPAAGKYFLVVSRIGYAVGASTPVDLTSSETRPVELTASWNQIFLPEILVEGKTFCGKATEERALAATLWDQIRQALIATSLSERSGLTLHSRTVDRTVSASGVIREEQTSPARLTGSRPFVPVPPAQLAEFGYVRAADDSVVYNAPDAESLLADPFVETHCFGVRAGQKGDSLKVGLTFEPVKTRAVADIGGVLWVDRHTLELRTLEFHYVSSNQSVLESNAWGRLEFSKLPSGGWYIRSWFIRMPEIVRTLVKTTFHDKVVGFREHGGSAELLEATNRPLSMARLSGRVTDSLSGGGLAGVVISIAGGSEFAVTDSLGAYTLAVPVSGARVVTFAHPLLAGDSLRTQRVVELVPGGAATASTSTPGPTAMVRTLCPKDRGKAGLIGRIVTETGAPAPGVYLRAEWLRADAASTAATRSDVTTTNDAGLWSFCDLPPRASVTLRLGPKRSAGPARSIDVEESGFRWLTLVASSADVGQVVPIDSAQRLPDLTSTAKIPIPPADRFLAELRDRIRRNGAPASALITRDELEKSQSFRLASLLVRHGLRSRVNKYGKETLMCPRKAERPAIYLDGLLVDGSDSPNAKRFRIGLINEMFDMENLTPGDVEAVEVYRSPGEWPAEFGRTEASCVVLIWTRRGEKQP
jgi:hypothetical protein